MLLLTTAAHPTMLAYRQAPHGSHLGRLLTPRHYNAAQATAAAGIPWAADNDGFQGVDPARFAAMLDAITGLPGCAFVTAPDVVADHAATVDAWQDWAPRIRDAGHPPAFVLQDGLDGPDDVPDDAGAVFVGGTTAFKLGDVAAATVAGARARGLWAHMGRVNSFQRIAYAAQIGCDSVDGTKYARFRRTHLPNALLATRNASAAPQAALDLA